MRMEVIFMTIIIRKDIYKQIFDCQEVCHNQASLQSTLCGEFKYDFKKTAVTSRGFLIINSTAVKV